MRLIMNRLPQYLYTCSLYPMTLKKYLLLSSATVWTLVLVIAVIATLVHQINYQDSAQQLNYQDRIGVLNYQVKELRESEGRYKDKIGQYQVRLQKKDQYIRFITSRIHD